MQVPKIENIKISQPRKPSIFKRICQKYADIKETIHDIYIYRKNRGPETYTMIGDKRYRDRDLPNSIRKDYELASIRCGRAVFSPEDEEKMKTMSEKERWAYEDELLKQKKYTVKWY